MKPRPRGRPKAVVDPGTRTAARRAGDRLRKADAIAETARAELVALAAEHGVTAVAESAGVSHQRLSQLVSRSGREVTSAAKPRSKSASRSKGRSK